MLRYLLFVTLLVAAHVATANTISQEIRDDLLELQQGSDYCWSPAAGHSLVTQGKDAVANLKEEQLELIELVLRFFQDEENVRTIGQLIREDIGNDVAPEIGGIVTYEDGELDFRPIQSGDMLGELSLLSPEENVRQLVAQSYFPPPASLLLPHVFQFHIHAFENSFPHACGPSFMSTGKVSFGGDIGYTMDRIAEHAENHHLLVDRRNAHEFAVYYFGGYHERFNYSRVQVVQLGVYSY